MDFKCIILIVHLKKLPPEIRGVKELLSSFKTIRDFCVMPSITID